MRDAKDFCTEVDRALSLGFELYGNPSFVLGKDGKIWNFQVVVA